MTEDELIDLILTKRRYGIITVLLSGEKLSENTFRALYLTILDCYLNRDLSSTAPLSSAQYEDFSDILDYFMATSPFTEQLFKDFIIKQRLPIYKWSSFIDFQKNNLHSKHVEYILKQVLLNNTWPDIPDKYDIAKCLLSNHLITTKRQLNIIYRFYFNPPPNAFVSQEMLRTSYITKLPEHLIPSLLTKLFKNKNPLFLPVALELPYPTYRAKTLSTLYQLLDQTMNDTVFARQPQLLDDIAKLWLSKPETKVWLKNHSLNFPSWGASPSLPTKLMTIFNEGGNSRHSQPTL